MSHANFLESLGWAVLNSLWQFAFLWIVYQVLSLIIRSSSLKGKAAAVLLITGFGWFLFTFLEAWLTTPVSVLSEALSGTAGNHAVNTWLEKVLPAASVIYLVLLGAPLFKFIKNYRYVQVIRSYGLSKMNVDWRLFVQRISVNIGLRRKVQVWVSELVSSPVTIGFIKPVILIPVAALNNLTTQQLEAILLHELSHIKRNDYLVNLVINIIRTILYFNPFVKAFVNIIEREREKSCDELVLQFQYDSHEYASALLLLEKSGYQQPLQLRATGRKSDLLHRVEWIMGVQKTKVLSVNHLASVLSGLLLIIGINVLVLLHKPLAAERNLSFSHVASSFNFFTGSINTSEPIGQSTEPMSELPRIVVTNHTQPRSEPKASLEPMYASHPVSYPSAASYLPATYGPEEVAQLKGYQEQHVKAALESSKKVLESIQWKMIEQSIADAFNQKEKEEIRSVYEKEVNKIDWKEWENNLRSAYKEIDWETVNSQLDKAVTEVRIDSIQKVYTLALTKLDKVQSQLKLAELKGIPDSDITLHEIEKARAETLRAISTMKAIRNKKIIHL